MTFESKLSAQTISTWFVFHKNIAFWSLLQKSPNFWNVCFPLAFFHFRINFVPGPKDNTHMVAIPGLNDFEGLWTPTGIIWFSNIFRGAISIPKDHTYPKFWQRFSISRGRSIIVIAVSWWMSIYEHYGHENFGAAH